MGISRPEEFLHSINACSDNKDMLVLAEQEKRYLCSQYQLTSLRSAFTLYRNYLSKNAFFDKENIEKINHIFTLTAKQKKTIHEAYIKQIQEDMGKLRKILDVDRFVDISVRLLGESSYLDKILGIGGLSGRRLAEIATSAKMEIVDASTVNFQGQLKVKGRGVVPPYKIPILGEQAHLVVKTLKVVREMRPIFVNSPVSFHNSASKDLNWRVKKYYRNVVTGVIRPKDLRAIYATICKNIFAPEDMCEKIYYSKILGHGENDIHTGDSYCDFWIPEL